MSVDKIIKKDIANGYPGCVLVVLKDDHIITRSEYGFKSRYDKNGAELDHPEKIKYDTVFDLASNTKIYATVFAVMKLVSDGLLDIDKPVKHYIREFAYDNVTARHLLTHSSGYGPEIWFFHDKNMYGKKFYSHDRGKTIELLLKEAPQEYIPGEKSIYSDTGFMVLGLLVEKISGLRQDKYLTKNIYNPLGLKKTLFNPLNNNIKLDDIAATSFGNTCNNTLDYPKIRKDVIRGKVQDEKAYYSMGGVAGHAGLFSTANEVAILAQLILNKGVFKATRIFKQDVVQEFLKPSTPDKSFGCGWRILCDEKCRNMAGEYVSSEAVGHTGFTGTVTVIDMKYNLAVIMLTNKIHTQCIHRQDYIGNQFNTGKYHPVISEIYKTLNLTS